MVDTGAALHVKEKTKAVQEIIQEETRPTAPHSWQIQKGEK